MPSNAIMFKKLTSAGSDKVWIPGSTTPSAHSYNWSGKPLNRTQDMGYGGGLEVKGPFYEDDISIGGITAHDFQFFVNSEGKGGFGDYGAEGIFGLCYCPSTDKQNSSSFFETLVIQKKVREAVFGVFIGRGGEAGELVLGGYDSKRFLGRVTTVSVVEQGPWGIRVDGAYVNGKMVPSSRGNCELTCIPLRDGLADSVIAIVDTGTPGISAPFAAAQAIHEGIPGAVRTNDKTDPRSVWAYPCNTPQAFMPSVIIGGFAHPIDAADFNNGNVTDEKTLNMIGKGGKSPMCVSAMVGFGDTWNLGRPFLQSYYTVFHWGELYTGSGVGKGAGVSFAQAVHRT